MSWVCYFSFPIIFKVYLLHLYVLGTLNPCCMMCQYFPQGSVIFYIFVVFEAAEFRVFKLSNGEGYFPTNTLLLQPSLHLWCSWVALTVIKVHVIFKSAGHQWLVCSLFYFETESCCIIQAGLELTVLLPHECWGCRHRTPSPAFWY